MPILNPIDDPGYEYPEYPYEPPPPEETAVTAPAATETTDPYASFFDADGKFKGDYQGFFRKVFEGQTTLTGDQLKAKKDILARAGMNVVTSPSGNTAWVNWPGSGGDWDVIGDYGGANILQWLPPGSGAGAPTTTATSPALTAAQLAAQEALVTYPDFAPPEFNAPEFNAPGQFAYPDYASPTPEEAAAEPGYEFGRKEGLRAMTNASSAQGLLRTGGTLKDMMAYGQGLAGQQYRDVDTRKRTTWEGNRFNQADIYDRDYRNAITENMLGYNREADIYNRALSTYGTNLGTAGSRAGISSDMQDRRWGQLLSLYNIATRNLPSYTPTAPSISPTGFTG